MTRRISLKFGNNKGVALIATFLVVSVMVVYSAVFVGTSINQNITSDIFKRRARAFNLAEAGLDNAIVWLRAQASPPVGDQTNPWGGVANLGGGTYSVIINDLGLSGGLGSTRRYKVVSTGTFANMDRILTNYVQVDNYSRYIWFTDTETFGGRTVWFWTLDTLNGPIHTNAHFNIYRDPTFLGEVASVDNYIYFYNNGNNIALSQSSNPPYDNPNFAQGISFGAEQTNMPHQALNLRSAASSGGLYLTGDSTVVLNSTGTMNLVNAAYCSQYACNNISLPANGALFVNNGQLTVSGTLNGRMTVGASGNINIPDNIVYADNPRINPNSDDVLGIISESDVVMPQNSPAELEIDASIMALDTSFYLNNWGSAGVKGTLTVYGGIIQDERGPVGTFNGATGQKISGYSKNYAYDPRLLDNPPPFMPTTGDYVTLSWEEN